MATSAPPPPPQPKSHQIPSLDGRSQPSIAGVGAVFTRSGDNADNSVFEFPEVPVDKASISLRTIVRQYLGIPQVRSVPANQIQMILGRLRCLHHSVSKYNEGIRSPNEAFSQYWHRRTLNLLSGFGFQVQSAQQTIEIAGLQELLQAVDDVYADQVAAARELIGNKLITFEALGELYRPDVPVIGRTGLGGTQAVFMVTDYYYQERRSLMGMEKSFHLSMDFVATMGQHFSVVSFTEVLSGWMGVRARPFSELTYAPIDPSEACDLQERGEKYARFGVGGPQFLCYRPSTFFLHFSGGTNTQAGGALPPRQRALASSNGSQLLTGGRIMIDPARGAALGHHASHNNDEPSLALVQLAGRYRRWLNTQAESSSSSGRGGSQEGMFLWETVPRELSMYCWPALVGFSFTAKAWGHVLVAGLEPIAFHDQVRAHVDMCME
jgi:hypothetical protein